MDNETNIDVAVTLINGTWAENAAWTMDGSTYRQVLSEVLSADRHRRVHYFPFSWRGENTHDGRRRASIKLRRQLRRQLRIQPAAVHFLVAHSHGANVALRTLRRSRYLRSHIRGLICIATPFLRFKKMGLFRILIPQIVSNASHEVSRWISSSLKWIGIAVLFLPLTLGLNWLTSHFLAKPLFDWLFGFWKNACEPQFSIDACEAFPKWLALIFFAVYAVFFMWSALIIARSKTLRKMCATLPHERRTILRRYSYSEPSTNLGSIPILGVSSVIDEALLALDGSWWAHRLAGSASTVIAILLLALAVVGFTMVEVAIYSFTSEWHASSTFRTLGSIAAIFLLAVPAMIFFSLLRPVVALAASIGTRMELGLGFDERRSNLLWKASATRHASWLAGYEWKRYGVWTLLANSTGLFFHSRVYSCRATIVEMARWIARHS